MERFDGYNYRPKMKTEWEPQVCVWLNNGTDEDLKRANEYAAKEGYMVLAFDVSDKQWQEKARAAAIDHARSKEL
jgi:dienelactone hydrolase